MDPKVALLGALAGFTLYFIVMLSRAIVKKRAAGEAAAVAGSYFGAGASA